MKLTLSLLSYCAIHVTDIEKDSAIDIIRVGIEGHWYRRERHTVITEQRTVILLSALVASLSRISRTISLWSNLEDLRTKPPLLLYLALDFYH